MSRLSLDCRRFLKLVGATALTYPLLRGVPSYAAGGPAGPYLVLLFTGCGVVRYLWGAQGQAPAGTTGPSAVTSPLVFRADAPCCPPRPVPRATRISTNQVIVLDGLSNKAAGQRTLCERGQGRRFFRRLHPPPGSRKSSGGLVQ